MKVLGHKISGQSPHIVSKGTVPRHREMRLIHPTPRKHQTYLAHLVHTKDIHLRSALVTLFPSLESLTPQRPTLVMLGKPGRHKKTD
jgi:hypothetical protein